MSFTEQRVMLKQLEECAQLKTCLIVDLLCTYVIFLFKNASYVTFQWTQFHSTTHTRITKS